MTALSEWIQETLGIGAATQARLLNSLLAIALLWALRRLALSLIRRRVDDVKTRYHWRKALTYVAVMIGLLVIGRIWFEGVRSLTTFLGLVSAGIAIALKDLLVNLAGWGFLLWRRPFVVGDRIQIGVTQGDVIDLRVFQFTLLEIGNWVHADQSTGRVVHVPNGIVFSQPLANYSKGFEYIWNELPVLVTFESNWAVAKELLLDVAKRHAAHLSENARDRLREVSQRFMIFYSSLTPTVYTSVVDSGVLLTIRYLCQPRNRRGSAQAMWEDILQAFASHDDIDFAYPTQRFFDNRIEGKATPIGP